MIVEFLPAAVQEVEDAFAWYESQLPGLGYEFIGELDATMRRISAWPESSGKLTRDLRRSLMRRFPYGLIYSIDAGCVIIVAVAHLHRKPSCWKKRTPSE